MAFDLNKNNGSGKDSSGKTPASSKFNLSKGEADEAVVTDRPVKSKTGVIGLIGILIIGGGIWYYSSKPANTADKASTVVVAPDSSVTKLQSGVQVTDTTVVTPSTSQKTPIVENAATVPAQTAASKENAIAVNLNNKIPATFGQGSSSFSQIDQSLIKRIITYLTGNPGASINVNGYASSDGSLAINQTVSQARADAFKKYLVSKGIAENRVIALGKGIENPIASNNSNAGRKKNRRVEITLSQIN